MNHGTHTTPGPVQVTAWPRVLSETARGHRGRGWQVVVWLVLALVLLRLLAPFILTRLANHALAAGEEVRGSISGLSLSLLGCAYEVHGLDLKMRQDDGTWLPFLQIEHIHNDLAWGPLLRGELIGDVTVSRPVLEVTVPPPAHVTPLATANGPASPPWETSVRTVVRARLTRLVIVDGEVRITDRRTGVTWPLTDITAEVDELIIPRPALTHRCHFQVALQTPGQGVLSAEGEVDLLARVPTFLLKAQVEHLQLPELNPLTKADGLAFAAGTFDGYSELVSDGRRLGGYLKVLFHHLDIATFGDAAADARTSLFWSLVIEAAEEVLENTSEHQHAARIPLHGDLGDPGADVWTTIGTALGNAFIRALRPGFARQDD